jgi:hypothetical protein
MSIPVPVERSFARELRLLRRTLPALWRGRGAY